MALFFLAYGAGLLSTVNPCGFALLPAYVGFYLGDDESRAGYGPARRVLRGFGSGIALSVGFAGTFVVVGLILAAGLREIVGAIPWAAVLIGVVLLMLGVVLLSGRHVGMRLPAGFSSGPSRGPWRVVLFGVGYAVASLSCTVAVFLALIGQALSAGSVPRLLGVFVAYGLGAATVLIALSVSAALAQAALAQWMRRFLPVVGRLGGLALTVSGLYLIAYWLPQVLHPGSIASQSVAQVSEFFSSALTGFLAEHELVVAGVGAVVVAGSLGLLAILRTSKLSPRAINEGDNPQLGAE